MTIKRIKTNDGIEHAIDYEALENVPEICLGYPSGESMALDFPSETDTILVAPDYGWFQFRKSTGIGIYDPSTTIENLNTREVDLSRDKRDTPTTVDTTQIVKVFARKGDEVKVSFTPGGTIVSFIFLYAAKMGGK